jgi:hypothetical protein
MNKDEVPNPDDDISEKTNNTIDFMVKTYEPRLIELLNQTKPDHNYTPNSYRYILGFCVRTNQNFISLLGSRLSNDEDLNECIKQMNKVSHEISPLAKMHFLSLANEIGEIYIQVWKSM